MNFKIDGLDDLIDSLEELQDLANQVNNMDGEKVPFDDLFPKSFMRQYTDADDIEKFFESSPWKIGMQEEFEDIPETELDRYVDNHSRFRTWEQMKGRAGNELVKRRLNL